VIRRTHQRLQDPATLVALLIGGQVFAWTLAPALTHSAPPLDVVEGYMWGREWVLATYKHPALPSWALEASRIVTGAVGWPAYLLSQLCIGATFLLVYLLGREVMGRERAAAGTLLLTGIAFYAWPTPEFNHNIAETPLWAALPWALWHAVERRRLVWWVLVGVFAAAGLYAKLSTVLLLVTMAGWILWDVRARQCLRTPGPWLGLAAFLLLATPLALWLYTHELGPLHYAAQRSMQAQGHGLPSFLLSVASNLVGLLAMLWIAGLLGSWRHADPPANKAEPPAPPIVDRAKHYLAVLSAGPLTLAIVSALLSGSSLKSAWGSSMFNLAGLLAVALTAHRFDGRALQRIAVCAAVLLIVVPLGYAVVVLIGPQRDAMRMRVIWPQAQMSERLAAIWARETGKPLRIVGGDNWIAGLVGVSAKDNPSIFTNGDPAYAPWITPERLQREGMLIVWDARTKRIPPALQPLLATHKTGEERFRFQRAKPGKELAVGYAVIPPK